MSKFYSLRIMVLPISLVAQLHSQAQDNRDSTIVPKELEAAIVTASRKAEPERLIPAAVSSVQQAQLLQFGSRTTPEALLLVNGVFIQKTNHGGGSPFVRGVTGNQVLMLVDGIRLNNSTFRYGPNQYLNTIDAFSIKSIEVARGTGSVQYGSDALGGVIQVFTHEPAFSELKSRWKGKVGARYMSGDMEKTVRGEGSYSGTKMAASFGMTHRNFGDLIGGDTTGRQSPSGYSELAFDVKVKFRLSKNTQFILAHQNVKQHHVPVYHKTKLENFALNEMDPQRRLLSYGKLLTHTPNKFFKIIEFIISHQHTEEVRNSLKNGSTSFRAEKDKVATIGTTIDIYSAFTQRWSANSGIEFYYDKVNSTRQDINTTTGMSSFKRGLYPDDSNYGNYSVYSLHHFGIGKWKLDAGIRFNTFSIRITDTLFGNVHITPSAMVSNAGVLYSFNKEHQAYVSFNTAYRAPNVDDMGTLGIVDFRYEVPASELLPEKSLNYEAGYRFRSERWAITASMYYMRLKNIITRVREEGQVIAGYPVYKKENNEEAFMRGAELELNVKLTHGLSVLAMGSYIYGQSETRREPMRRIPPANGRIVFTWKKFRWFAAAESVMAADQNRLAQGDKDDNRIPAGGTPGWKIFNLYAGYETESLKLNIGGQNLLNKDYRTHGSGINGYGRSVWFNIVFWF